MLSAHGNRGMPMSKSIFVFVLAILACRPALSADLSALSTERGRHVLLRPERLVIEVVRPPYSGSFIINGANFTAKSAACSGWTAGDRITLLAGDWHGRCVDAVFHNVARHGACQMWCG
jgi:hypothetical protein